MIFETILAQAAQLAKEQEARTEALKEARRREVYGDLVTRKSYPSRKAKGKRRTKGDRVLEPHKKYILDKRQKNLYLREIARDLKRDFNISVCTQTLSSFIRECQKNG